MIQTRRRAAILAAQLVLFLGMGVFADQTAVTNRGSNTVTFFDSATNTELPGSPVTVGTTPVEIVADQPAGLPAQRYFVVNSGSNSVSVLWASNPRLQMTISSDVFYGAFVAPSGAALIPDLSVGPAIAIIDQKTTGYVNSGMPAAGRSTIRFFSPVTNTELDAFQEPSPTARYTHIVYTSNRRLWIADDGDKGVAVIKLNAFLGAPYYYPQPIQYQGAFEYADFIRDTAVTRTFLLAPKRLATDGSTRVVVADGGSSKVTILDAAYVPTNAIGEPNAILSTVDLSTVPGASLTAFTCADVAVVGNFAYVTTSNLAAAGVNCFQIDLTTFAVTTTPALGGANGVAGIGATSDGKSLYVGEATGGGLNQLDIDPPADFTTAAVPVAAFTGGSVPFAFTSSATVATGGGGTGGWVNQSTAASTGNGGCGLLGLEAVLLLLGLAALRRA